MTKDDARDLAVLGDGVRTSWRRFLDTWDAEDLVQDALARAFVTLGLANIYLARGNLYAQVRP